MIITKIEAARSQLIEAITLFFEGRDPVSIHTLTGAALQILNDHIQDTGIVWDNNLICHFDTLYIKDEYRKEWYSRINEARNFFKHADKDLKNGKTSIDFEPSVNEFHVLESIRCLRIVEGDQYVHSFEFRVFLAWFILNHPHLLQKEGHDILSKIQNLSGKSRADFAEMISMAKRYPEITESICPTVTEGACS